MHSEISTHGVKKFLPFFLILCSLIGGAIGASWFLFFTEKYFSETGSQALIPVPLVPPLNDTHDSSLQSLEKSITEEIARVSPSVVSIIVKKDLVVYRSDPWGFFEQPIGNVERKVGGGSGFFIKADGTILTNKHVVSDPNAAYTVISNDGTEYDARVLALDPLSDLAVIKIESGSGNLFPITAIIADSENVEIGSFTLAIGNALAEFQNSVSLGIVSGKDRSIEASGEQLSGLIQTDAAINPGNSGGPLINLAGKIIGINTAVAYDSTGIGFAIELSQEKIDYILKSIAKSGKIQRPFIGINYIPNSPWVQNELGLWVDYGAYIIDEAGSVLAWSSGQKAGLEPGDIILEVAGEKITQSKTLGSFIQNSIPGQILKLKVLKKSEEQKNIDLELGSY
jgi:serine protease Do